MLGCWYYSRNHSLPHAHRSVAPPRAMLVVPECPANERVLAFTNYGANTSGALQPNQLTPALRQVRAASVCAFDRESENLCACVGAR